MILSQICNKAIWKIHQNEGSTVAVVTAWFSFWVDIIWCPCSCRLPLESGEETPPLRLVQWEDVPQAGKTTLQSQHVLVIKFCHKSTNYYVMGGVVSFTWYQLSHLVTPLCWGMWNVKIDSICFQVPKHRLPWSNLPMEHPRILKHHDFKIQLAENKAFRHHLRAKLQTARIDHVCSKSEMQSQGNEDAKRCMQDWRHNKAFTNPPWIE